MWVEPGGARWSLKFVFRFLFLGTRTPGFGKFFFFGTPGFWKFLFSGLRVLKKIFWTPEIDFFFPGLPVLKIPDFS